MRERAARQRAARVVVEGLRRRDLEIERRRMWQRRALELRRSILIDAPLSAVPRALLAIERLPPHNCNDFYIMAACGALAHTAMQAPNGAVALQQCHLRRLLSWLAETQRRAVVMAAGWALAACASNAPSNIVALSRCTENQLSTVHQELPNPVEVLAGLLRGRFDAGQTVAAVLLQQLAQETRGKGAGAALAKQAGVCDSRIVTALHHCVVNPTTKMAFQFGYQVRTLCGHVVLVT